MTQPSVYEVTLQSLPNYVRFEGLLSLRIPDDKVCSYEKDKKIIDHKGLLNIELLALKLSLLASINFLEVLNCLLIGRLIF